VAARYGWRAGPGLAGLWAAKTEANPADRTATKTRGQARRPQPTRWWRATHRRGESDTLKSDPARGMRLVRETGHLTQCVGTIGSRSDDLARLTQCVGVAPTGGHRGTTGTGTGTGCHRASPPDAAGTPAFDSLSSRTGPPRWRRCRWGPRSRGVVPGAGQALSRSRTGRPCDPANPRPATRRSR
jgi:hypothetical protein